MIESAMLMEGQLSGLGDNNSDVACPSFSFPFLDWDTNEEERFVDGTSKSQWNQRGKRLYNSEEDNIDDYAPQH